MRLSTLSLLLGRPINELVSYNWFGAVPIAVATMQRACSEYPSAAGQAHRGRWTRHPNPSASVQGWRRVACQES